MSCSGVSLSKGKCRRQDVAGFFLEQELRSTTTLPAFSGRLVELLRKRSIQTHRGLNSEARTGG